MSSNTMNFGPEWMRRLSKSNAPGSADLTTRASTNNSPVPINPSVVTSTPGGGNSSNANTTFSYSSVAANSRTNSRRNTLTQLEGLEDELKTPVNDVHFVDQLNPFKYSKEFMLSLYKPVGLPLDFEKHEYVTSDDCLPPMASIELTDQEKKLLSGSVNSDLTRRIVHQSASSGHTRGERGSHRGGVSGMGRGRGGSSHNKDSFRDEEKLDQGRFSKSIMLRENPLGSNLDEAMWSNVTRHAVGTFDSDGVFRFGGENVGDALESLEALQISDDQFEQEQSALLKETLFRNSDQEASNISHQEAQQHSQRLNRAILSLGGNSGDDGASNQRPINIVEALSKKPDNERSLRDAFAFGGHGGASPSQSPPDNMRIPEGRYAAGHPSMHDYHEIVPPHLLRWLYKDPSGNIQGPFSPEDMHEWFEGGFFTPSLLVRREDEQMFEPLGILIQRVGDDTKPFLVAAYKQIRFQPRRKFYSFLPYL
ncbi:kinesin-like protein [Basidiobolus ranarum]|uniref:Kinesin-like protein n=1 Tax=Basidiobolus ranarum TaxID=34480 RepID=A0ABR2WWI0_9FUNG